MSNRLRLLSAVLLSAVVIGCDSRSPKSTGTVVILQPTAYNEDMPEPAGGDVAGSNAAGRKPTAGNTTGSAGKNGSAGGEPGNFCQVAGLSETATSNGDYPPPPDSAEVSPARAVVSDMSATAQGRKVYTREVHNMFLNLCGNCHAAQAQGEFQVPTGMFLLDTDFSDVMTGKAKLRPELTLETQAGILGSMEVTDPNSDELMPPKDAPGGGKLLFSRAEDDPVRVLYDLLTAWYRAGAPNDYFILPPDPNAPQDQYKLPANVAAQLTNIGSSIPKAASIATQAERMKQMDDFFASATALPERLDQTDLVSFDSEVLAGTGVISFAPTYPLFSDNAHKLRHIRVPFGTSVVFKRDTQDFEIPANTRIYKTFLKRVDDADGNPHYRKIETRLIVSRPDGADAPDGSHETNALFGTYAWNEAETEAHLVTDPLRNGKPFLDRLLIYPTQEIDESQAHQEQALLVAGKARTYGIPGSERCVQCHMGSPSHSFILGFAPLQIQRRATDTGGTYESTGRDELTQLARLICYGVITGITSADDILPLEQSQAERKPRNDYELKAQAYMVGNCANCHNPRGYPTIKNPVLHDVLDFWPRADKSGDHRSGIFQFPLDLMSPRIKRGPENAERQRLVPYITPSLFDYGGSNDGGFASHIAHVVDPESGAITNDYLAAPWRSLIYRNVETPYLYFADDALFPHMPMNTPGFDVRLPQIMGDWMVSIPARLRADLGSGLDELTTELPQPYEEVPPEDQSAYAAAKKAADARLKLYHEGGPAGIQYKGNQGDIVFVPYQHTLYSPNTSDIVDARTSQGCATCSRAILTPPDLSSLPSLLADKTRTPDDPGSALGIFEQTTDDVPDAPHWVVTDTTEWPGAWVPRRSDWADVLFGFEIPDAATDELKPAVAQQRLVVRMLQNLRLSDAFRAFATQPNPVAVWDTTSTPDCDFSSVPKAKEFSGPNRPRWFDLPTTHVKDDDPIYMLSPGGVVFTEICSNCHGRDFDSHGRMSDALTQITGGHTRVANFREGMFGPIVPGSSDPTQQPGYYRDAVFGPEAVQALTGSPSSLSGDDLAAHYLAWMALGGTQSVLDANIMRAVGSSQVFGTARADPFTISSSDANMLSIARLLCAKTIAADPDNGARQSAPQFGVPSIGDHYVGQYQFDGTSLVESNGDADTWVRLCAFENPAPIRVVKLGPNHIPESNALYSQIAFPADADVGQGASIVKGVKNDNPLPWCYVPSASAGDVISKSMDELRSAHQPVPICPADWLSNASPWTPDQAKLWILRGAINAGFAVFAYLERRAKDAQAGLPSPPLYNECGLLSKH